MINPLRCDGHQANDIQKVSSRLMATRSAPWTTSTTCPRRSTRLRPLVSRRATTALATLLCSLVPPSVMNGKPLPALSLPLLTRTSAPAWRRAWSVLPRTTLRVSRLASFSVPSVATTSVTVSPPTLPPVTTVPTVSAAPSSSSRSP